MNIPTFPISLPGTIWGITCYFNPQHYSNRRKNYDIFRQASKANGLKLLCVELAIGNSEHELKDGDADILIRRRAGSVLWQKERLLNLGLKNLPLDCDKIIWIDCDVLFSNSNWIEETTCLLERYVIVQPFSYVRHLPRGVISPDSPYPADNEKGVAFSMAHTNNQCAGKNLFDFGHPGFAWAARRAVFHQYGFYDRLIAGGGDLSWTHAFYGVKRVFAFVPVSAQREILKDLWNDYMKWLENIYPAVGGSIYYVNGTLYHLWHGRMEDRGYWWREQALMEFKYNPLTDIRLDSNECWEWTGKNPRLENYVRGMFFFRNEDGSRLRSLAWRWLSRLWWHAINPAKIFNKLKRKIKDLLF